MLHVRVYDLQSEMVDRTPQFLHPFLIGGDHGADVGHILLDVACRIFSGTEESNGLGLTQAALFDKQEVIDQYALFLDNLAVRRHRTRRDAADIGVMPAGTNVKQYRLSGIVED